MRVRPEQTISILYKHYVVSDYLLCKILFDKYSILDTCRGCLLEHDGLIEIDTFVSS